MSTKLSAQTRTYIAKNGKVQFQPSLQLVMTMNGENEGFCLACGQVQPAVEPDGIQYLCHSCGAHKVYGSEELVMMGLTFDAA